MKIEIEVPEEIVSSTIERGSLRDMHQIPVVELVEDAILANRPLRVGDRVRHSLGAGEGVITYITRKGDRCFVLEDDTEGGTEFVYHLESLERTSD